MASITTRIGPADHGRKLTLDEFRDAEAEPGYHYELAQGVLEVVDIPGTPQRRITSNLYGLVRDYQRDHPGVIDYYGGGSEIRIWAPEMESVRHPDLGVIFVNAPPDDLGDPRPGLVAEVVSARSKIRDYVTKRQEYLVYGVREYWIVDSYLRQITVLTRQETETETTWAEQIFSADEVIGSTVLPGLVATVTDLWLGVRWEEL